MTKDNKAYLLYDTEYDDYYFYGIFSTKKQIKEYIELHISDNPWLSYCCISELPLNPTDKIGRIEFNGLLHKEELSFD